MTGLAEATDQGLSRVIDRATEWLSARRLTRFWWVPLALGVASLTGSAVALRQLAGALRGMHTAGAAGRMFQGVFGPAHLHAAVVTWAAFWRAHRTEFARPDTLARASILVDWIFFIPGYTVAGLVVLVREHNRAGSYLRPVLRWAALALVGTAALDALVENPLQWVLIGHGWSGGSPGPMGHSEVVLDVASNLKWALALVVVIALLITAVVRFQNRTAATRQALRLLRGQVAVVVLAVAAFNLPIQLDDVLDRLTVGQAVWLAAAAALFGWATWATGQAVIRYNERRVRTVTGGRGPWLMVAVVTAGLAAVAWVNVRAGEGVSGAIVPIIPVLLCVGLAVLGMPVRVQERRSPTPSTRRQPPPVFDLGPTGHALPGVLAAVGVLVVGLAPIRAGVAEAVQHGQKVRIALAAGVGIVGLSIVVLVLGELWRRRSLGRARVAVWLVGAGAAALVAVQVANPDDARSLGGAVVVLTFLVALTIVAALLVLGAEWWVDHHDVPAVLRPLRVRAVPVLTLVVAWAVLAATVDDGAHWNVNVTERPGQPANGVALQAAFNAWLAKATPAATAPGGGPAVVPLVLVAASGGGIRAAYWTALAMDCIFGGHDGFDSPAQAAAAGARPCAGASGARPTSAHDLFLASGISGGSLGLVEWDAYRTGPPADAWVPTRLGGDFITPTLAQGLLVEVARSFLHFPSRDRADVLEKDWAQAWGPAGPANPLDQGFLAAQAAEEADQGGPLLMLNGDSVFDGCALNTSILDLGSTVDQRPYPSAAEPKSGPLPVTDCLSVQRYLDERPATPPATTPGQVVREPPGPLPATADLLDYLDCGAGVQRDVSRATAALLSARFPYVSPAGRLEACGLKGSTKFVLDGGIVDTSGAESAVSLWLALQPLVEAHNAGATGPKVVPYFVQIDNDYEPTTSAAGKTKSPNQLLAPLQALLKTTGLDSRASRARNEAAELFTRPFAVPGLPTPVTARYARIAPQAHPGVQASLGWTLSPDSQKDLAKELFTDNCTPIATVRGWLTGPPSAGVPAAGCPP